ncbi:MAG: hydrogenase maturation protease [Thioploca sp.]|nr:hydrogenase maturation protease [Thioploca sp.]
MKLLLLGIGNLLLSDEGVGIHALRYLEQNYSWLPPVELLDGGTAGMELLAPITIATHLIILDAIQTQAPPGTVVQIAHSDIPAFFRTKLSSHQIGLADVLAAATLTDNLPRYLTLVGVVPASLKLGVELTPIVAAQVVSLASRVVQELSILGITVVAKQPSPI